MKSILNNLLIVEDNSFIGKNIINAVKEVSSINSISLTESLHEAISILENNHFEIVILDLKLPDGNGIQLLKLLKDKKIETKVLFFL